MEVTEIHVYLRCTVRFPRSLAFMGEMQSYMTAEEVAMIQRLGLAQVEITGAMVAFGLDFETEKGVRRVANRLADDARAAQHHPGVRKPAAHGHSRRVARQ